MNGSSASVWLVADGEKLAWPGGNNNSNDCAVHSVLLIVFVRSTCVSFGPSITTSAELMCCRRCHLNNTVGLFRIVETEECWNLFGCSSFRVVASDCHTSNTSAFPATTIQNVCCKNCFLSVAKDIIVQSWPPLLITCCGDCMEKHHLITSIHNLVSSPNVQFNAKICYCTTHLLQFYVWGKQLLAFQKSLLYGKVVVRVFYPELYSSLQSISDLCRFSLNICKVCVNLS